MWPWEHLAIGYLLYSDYVHARYGRSPDGPAALAVAFGTQFPDLVDKPLSWSLGLLPAGVFAHSIFVAGPIAIIVVTIASRTGRTEVGVAFVVGYMAHLPADAIYPMLLGGQPGIRFLFWPILSGDPVVGDGLRANTAYYFGIFLDFIQSPRGFGYLLLEFALLASSFTGWIKDGFPGIHELRAVFPVWN